jgi:hypothetical protein
VSGSDGDTDSFVASEASRDFMAKLRIGIMADSAPIPNPQEGLPTDMVFLQDVIARLAEQVWLTEPRPPEKPDRISGFASEIFTTTRLPYPGREHRHPTRIRVTCPQEVDT